jgi:hypothetical protein
LGPLPLPFWVLSPSRETVFPPPFSGYLIQDVFETVFGLVSFLHRIQGLADSTKGQDRYPYLAYCSSETISLSSPLGRARGWFAGVSDLLESVGIQIDRLPPFRYSLDAPGHLLPTRHVLNKIIRDDIYRHLSRSLGLTLLVGYAQRWPFMLSISWSLGMDSSLDHSIHSATGYMLFAFL